MHPILENISEFRKNNKKGTSTSHEMSTKEFHEIYFDLLEYCTGSSFDVKHVASKPDVVEVRIYNF